MGRFVCAIVCVITAGCYMDARVSVDGPAQVACRDLRDGETFTYHTKNAKARVGLLGAPHTLEFTDDGGVYRFLTSDAEAWIKCTPVRERRSDG